MYAVNLVLNESILIRSRLEWLSLGPSGAQLGLVLVSIAFNSVQPDEKWA
jgi:hypothetical protein